LHLAALKRQAGDLALAAANLLWRSSKTSSGCTTLKSSHPANVLAADAAGAGEETHGLAITAIEREGDPHPFTVVAAAAQRRRR
jgi:hypothetical protein